MNEQLKQIGERLRGLRDVLDISAEEVAELCDCTLEHYLKIESGEADPGVYRLSKISKRYGISLDVLLFGEEPRMSAYFVTRKGQGPSVERNQDYQYQSLAAGFRGRKVEIMLTEVDPMPADKPRHEGQHDGQEFDYVLEGTLEVAIKGKPLILNEGDSIYFDASQSHCMTAIGGKPAKFICVII